ncbi:translation elongation factor Ts [Boudabousia liubingyangii]|uniref:Elongation factor Ts n=1 Tax=Boudabousia liubingyangii TaxID=1921764 RepID=A0A1Q5PKQ3_9ACTO|nr:translation elongation factor Ts [Boudabousia liubingyangii]OKL46486.1 translation elongation factor Ts [Boudabousia liubingyangii]OKL47191.1 translation elongation factor Ts [Boudabousia liubingyangii]
MANYTTSDIKDLRAKTGAGLMDVKKALEEAEGDFEKALEIIRLKGIKSLSKREGRSASAGLVLSSIADQGDGQVGVMVEVNSETDFVAKNEKFIDFANQVLAAAVESGANDLESLLSAPVEQGTVQDLVDSIASVIGEKIVVSKMVRLEAPVVTSYLHHSNPDLPPQVGVLVATDAAAAEVAHDVALHIAAYQPEYLSRESVPAEVVEKERHTLEELTRSEGKPEAALPKIVEGRLGGFFKENCLLDQPFAKDPKSTVGQIVDATKGQVLDFKRFHVGA